MRNAPIPKQFGQQKLYVKFWEEILSLRRQYIENLQIYRHNLSKSIILFNESIYFLNECIFTVSRH